MVTDKESHSFQQFPAWNPPDSGCTALLQLEQNHPFLACVASPGQFAPNLHGLNTGQLNSGVRPLELVPPYQDMSYQKDALYTSPKMDKPLDAPYATRKRFLIFDQSGNNTRLFVSPCFTHSTTPARDNGLCEKVAPETDRQFSVKPEIQEKWEGSDVADEEGEMHEDTEEINALLYSSSDEHDDDDISDSDGENDEVTSRRHTPLNFGECYDKENLLGVLGGGEDVASSDYLPKRQKLLDGKYKKSSLTSVQCSHEDDSESSCANDINWSKRVKIRNTLKMIETIIPGLNSNDPMSIIDEAIVYLKSMRSEAKALGLSCLAPDSAAFS